MVRESIVSLPAYELGEPGRADHFTADTARDTAADEAKSLNVGDAAFILRSDYKWSYAIVAERKESDEIILTFMVDKENNIKTFPESRWGKYIRTIKVDAAELEKLKAEEAEKNNENAVKEGGKMMLRVGQLSSYIGSWLSTKLGSSSDKAKDTDTDKAEDGKHDAASEQDIAPVNAASKFDLFSIIDKALNHGKDAEGTQSPSIESADAEVDQTEKGKPVEIKDTENGPTESILEERDEIDETTTPEDIVGDREGAVEDANTSETKSKVQTSINAPESPPEKKPIKLLKTPFKFFKAPTMKEDPELAALDATSFADEQYDSLQSSGVVVCEHDPTAATAAGILEKERVYGHLENKGVVVVDTMACFEQQGIMVVENE